MEEFYPIVIDGIPAGKLSVRTLGGKTEFLAETRSLPGIVRISVYGQGREGYLGVLAPEGEGLTLRKTLSRTALREFPGKIDSVERAGLQAERRAAPAAEPEPEPEPEPIALLPSVPELPGAGEEDDDLFWYSSPDGALVRFDGEQNLIALPPDDPRIPAGGGGSPRQVDGREYLVFRTKNGRLLR